MKNITKHQPAASSDENDDAPDTKRPAKSKPSTPQKVVKPKISVDTVELVLLHGLIGESELADAAERMKTHASTRSISSKQETYLKRGALRCSSGATVIIDMLRSTARMRYDMKLAMNINNMTKHDVLELKKFFKHIFPLAGQHVFSKFLMQRVDTAFDIPTPINRLIVQTVGSAVEQKFVILTDRIGKVQTWYAGSVSSAERIAMYDQNASDVYKVGVGELPSKRRKPQDDAELLLTGASDDVGHRTRIEFRRVFKTALRLADADEQCLKFDKFKVFEVPDQFGTDVPDHFSLYLDSVRLRGVAGARAEFVRNNPGRRAKTALSNFEAALADNAARWWPTATKNVSIIQLLNASPAWSVMKTLMS